MSYRLNAALTLLFEDRLRWPGLFWQDERHDYPSNTTDTTETTLCALTDENIVRALRFLSRLKFDRRTPKVQLLVIFLQEEMLRKCLLR